MIPLRALVFSALATASWCAEDLRFPPGFKFGAATAAYQVEGAWNVSDKGESIWDHFIHSNPAVIFDGSNADVATDSYHLWKKDVEIAADLGLHFYRFSIAWSRLMPTGLPNQISEDGKNYYNALIDELVRHNIEPVVTLYHWDLPQRLQDLGGWTNPLVADWFADYARTAYSLYADRVKTWITLNEPLVVCDAAYNTGALAPGVLAADLGSYLCNKHALIAHAKAYRIYDQEYKPQYHGLVSLSNHLFWFEPKTPEDEEITELTRQYGVGRFSHAIYSKQGGWPPAIEKIVAENSKKQGYPSSRLPAFTPEEIELVKGTFDFYGFNHYTTFLVRQARQGEDVGSWPLGGGVPDLGAKVEANPDWAPTASSWSRVNPEGIRKQLAWLKKEYGDIKILITENGYGSGSGLEDTSRVQYYNDYLKQVLLAIKEDGVNVVGYTAWSLLDNFEWIEGYKTKFGLYEVDFEHPLRTRTPRKSARYYKNIIQRHSLDVRNFHEDL